MSEVTFVHLKTDKPRFCVCVFQSGSKLLNTCTERNSPPQASPLNLLTWRLACGTQTADLVAVTVSLTGIRCRPYEPLLQVLLCR